MHRRLNFILSSTARVDWPDQIWFPLVLVEGKGIVDIA